MRHLVVAALALGLAPPALGHADDGERWQLAFEAGAQVDAQPFGVANATIRKDAVTLRLITDTLELEVGDRTGGGGRYWIKARVQAFASQLLIGPWDDGAPDPDRALVSPHVGAEVGYVHHLPQHFYVGAQVFARWFWFFRRDRDFDPPAPDPTYWVSPEAFVGWWRGPERRAVVRGGVDFSEGLSQQEPFVERGARLTAPKVAFEGVFVPGELVVAPRLEVRAGWARDQGRLIRTRLGGLNPYVVPLAGAGWAEFLVEEYAVVRLGPNVRGDWGHAALVADLAAFDGQQEVAFALLGRADLPASWFVDLSVGWAPFLRRRNGTLRASAWILVGRGFEDL